MVFRLYYRAKGLTKRQDPRKLRRDVMKRFDVGARVVDPAYGHGIIVAVEDEYVRVQFDEHGVKKFLTRLSRLEPSTAPVPAGAPGGDRKRRRKTPKAPKASTPPAGDE
jgi:hypothetical protein